MITKWRSPDWVNPYGKPRMGKKASRWYELGADAMLQSLRAMGEIVMDAETGINGLNVVIPDDPQPIEKFEQFSIPEKLDNSKPQTMICPKAKTCELDNSPPNIHSCQNSKPHKKNDFCEIVNEYHPACVPYIEPEKEKKPPTYALHLVGNNDIHNRCAGKPVYDSSCPFCREIQSLKDRAINHSKMWQHHPASKVIEKGYFGIHAFVQVPTWVEIPSKGWTMSGLVYIL